MQKKIRKIIVQLQLDYPDTEISLDFKNIYQLLVATMLSAQTTDKMVNSITPELFATYPDIEQLADATPEELVPFIKSIGLYNMKSRSLVAMAKKVRDEYNGDIPASMKGLVSLPGVGRKTANVIMGNGFGITNSGITVDTHVKRIAKRLGLTKETTAKKVEQDLIKIVPKENWVGITHLLISHGRSICGARKPACDKCNINSYCDSAFDFEHFV